MGHATRGFETRIPLLQWLPGETFYSLCSRHHRFSGHPVSTYTTRALFGHSHAGNQHDFPSRLDSFVERVEGVHGDAAELARERTLLRFYAPFHQPSVVRDAVASMRSTSVAHLKYRLGLLTSRFRANHPLKACPACMASDVETSGWMAWHLEHQFPGVWICRRHQQPLLVSDVKATGVQRFSWQLPSVDCLTDPLSGLSSGVLDAHAGLSQFVGCVVTDSAASDGCLLPSVLQAAFREALAERGLMTPGGNVRLRELAPDYASYCASLRHVPELHALPDSPTTAAVELGRVFRQLRSGLHPLRLLVAGAWLFQSAEALLQVVARSPERLGDKSGVGAGEGNIAISLEDERMAFLRLLRDGASVTTASAVVGIATNTGLAWAAAAGCAAAPRPKVLKPDARARLVGLLRAGVGRAHAAAEVGVGVGTVDRLFQTVPQLHEAWTSARLARARAESRSAWTSALAVGSIKLARAMEPAAYAWLYRNDRDWLREHCDAMPRSDSAPRSSAVRWDERDASMADDLRRAALTLAKRGVSGPKLWQLYQAMPELKAKLSSLSRLPLTRKRPANPS